MPHDESGYVTVRSALLSLWQSCVDEVARRDGAITPERRKLMQQGANIHVHRSRQPDAAWPLEATDSDQERHAILSRYYFNKSMCTAGYDVTPEANDQDTRKYSAQDLAGWLSCGEKWAKYYPLHHNEPVYRNWRKEGGSNLSYSVIKSNLPNNAKVLLLGDWGTGMNDAVSMLQKALTLTKFDAIIHLGDIYYSGTEDECRDHVRDVLKEAFRVNGMSPIPFYNLPGNHDYYAGGAGFYTLLDEVNDFNAQARQDASYFCLKTEDGQWQFLGMDTGVNDRDPVRDFALGHPKLSTIATGPGIRADELEWHMDKLGNFSGNTILLSHHQVFSAAALINGRKTPFPPNINERLRNSFYLQLGKVSAWFWGHEHSFAAYADKTLGVSRGRLIGASSYEEEEADKPYDVLWPNAPYAPGMVKLDFSPTETGGRRFYNHNFAILDFERAQPNDPIKASYYQFPSWGQDDSMPTAEVIFMYSEIIGAPFEISAPEFFGNKKVNPSDAVINVSGEIGITSDETGNIVLCFMAEDGWDYRPVMRGATYHLELSQWLGGGRLMPGKDPRAKDGLACVNYDGRIWAFYNGVGNDQLFAMWRIGDDWHGDESIYELSGKTINPKTSETPAAVVMDGKLYIFYKGKGNNDVFMLWYDGQTWQGDKRISRPSFQPNTNKGPAAVTILEGGVEKI